MSVRQMMMGRQSGAAPFTDPSDIAGGVVWLDASDTATITHSSGSVSAWTDKFNSRVFSGTAAATTGAVTQNGLNVLSAWSSFLTYDAGSDAIDLDPWTCFIVAYDNITGANYHRIMSTRRSATGTADYQAPNIVFGVRNNGNSLGGNSNGVGVNGPAYTANAWHLFRTRATASVLGAAIDQGSETTSAGSTSPSNQRYLRIAMSCTQNSNPPASSPGDQWTGRIAEIVIYNAELTSQETSDVEEYLQAKWGL